MALAESLSVGPGIERLEFGANMGAMVSDPQRNRAEGLVEAAAAEGATVATGGRRLNLPGSFLAPTVISGVTPKMQIAGTEVFGPVLSVLKTGSEDEAINIANSTEYRLVGSIFTADIDATHRTAPPAASAPARSSSMNGMPAGWKPPSAAMANLAMAARRAARRCGTTCRPRTSPTAQGKCKPRPDPRRRKARASAAAPPPSRRHGHGGREARPRPSRPYWDE